MTHKQRGTKDKDRDMMTLCWNVPQFEALGDEQVFCGIMKKHARWRVSKSRTVYRGSLKVVLLHTIADLCRVFDYAPPGIFRWEDQRLIWHVDTLAREVFPEWADMPVRERKNLVARQVKMYAAVGFDPAADAQAQTSRPQPFDKVWMGWALGTHLSVIGRLCTVLQVTPGPLFMWEHL